MTNQIVSDFLPDRLPDNPMPLVAEWLAEARAAANQPNPNAMTLASCDANGNLSARIVLCKGLDTEHGSIDFYTNYRSTKARAIDSRNQVAVVFHWDHAARQVRIEGTASRVDSATSDRYFASRPRLSQMGAWASDQSAAIESRDALLQQFDARNAQHGEHIPRPPHWGGYRIVAQACELWVEGAGRVHDRARFVRDVESSNGAPVIGAWQGQRLQP
ncbi:MAG: pyridoxamine 5'-phosphate oxidase [Pseudomonadota bacterium]